MLKISKKRSNSFQKGVVGRPAYGQDIRTVMFEENQEISKNLHSYDFSQKIGKIASSWLSYTHEKMVPSWSQSRFNFLVVKIWKCHLTVAMEWSKSKLGEEIGNKVLKKCTNLGFFLTAGIKGVHLNLKAGCLWDFFLCCRV